MLLFNSWIKYVFSNSIFKEACVSISIYETVFFSYQSINEKKNSFFLKFHILKTFFFFQILFITRSGFSNFQNRKYSISISSNYEKKTIFPKSYMRDFYAFSNSVDENFNYGIQIP